MSRVGNGLLWAGGLVLAVLMVYTVALDFVHREGGASAKPSAVAFEVAVFYPDRVLWQEFRQGVAVCARNRLIEIVEDGESSVTVRTPRHRRLVRFRHHDVRGLRETRDEVVHLGARIPQPVAVVGSSNTVLTEAIAEALSTAAGPEGGKGPVLLIPWASAVLSLRPESGEGPVSLLDVDRGRTFRFCLNNQFQADLLVRCVSDLDAGNPPRRAVLVEDRFDPYSVDLASSFHRAVQRVAPSAEITASSGSLGLPIGRDRALLPSPEEEALAESICREAEGRINGQTTWVFLPLQEEPTQRLLLALRRHSRRGLKADSPLRVVCGDAVSVKTLSELAGRCPFPVWGISSASAKAPGQGVSNDVQIPAEMISALARCLDVPPDRRFDASGLRDSLASLKLAAGDSGSIGRSLVFSRSGERVGEDLGHILMIRPEQNSVYFITRGPKGAWSEPEALPPNSMAIQP